MKRLQIGLAEIGIFGTSLAMMGLVVWFLSLTLFGSSKNSEAKLLVSVGSGIPSSPALAPMSTQSDTPNISAVPEDSVLQAQPVLETQALDQARGPAKSLETSSPSEDSAVGGNSELDVPAPKPLENWAAALEEKNKEPVKSEPSKPEPFSQPSAAPPVEEKPIFVASAPQAMTEEKVNQEPQASSLFTAYNPSKGRDPMLKPEEVEMIRLRKQEREGVVKQQTKREASPLDVVRRRINVQGIMDTPDGIVAIVNNEIYSRGQVVAGAKILRILGNRVQFKYGTNIFEKKVNNE